MTDTFIKAAPMRIAAALLALATSPHATAQGSGESCPHCLPIVGHELAKRCAAAGQPAAVPDALDENARPDVWNMAYAAGWNDCRKAALAAAKKNGGAE